MSQPQECFIQTMFIFVYVCLCTPYQTVCLGMPACACTRVRGCAPVCFSCIYVPLSADGLMVQITVETMAELRRSLREMKDYTVTCGRLDQSEGQELVCVQWVEEKCTVNKGQVCPLKFMWQLPLSSDTTFMSKNWVLAVSCRNTWILSVIHRGRSVRAAVHLLKFCSIFLYCNRVLHDSNSPPWFNHNAASNCKAEHPK